MSTGDENSGTTPWISNKIADIHNHRNNSPPSPGDIYTFIDGRDESSLSYILQQYNVGLSLLKMNTSGEFKKIKTKETNTNRNPSYTPDNCL